jgi:hypothetical protein
MKQACRKQPFLAYLQETGSPIMPYFGYCRWLPLSTEGSGNGMLRNCQQLERLPHLMLIRWMLCWPAGSVIAAHRFGQ